MEEQICNAINTQKAIEFNYDGELRVVEPHRYGVTTAGKDGLRAYQIDGYSSSGRMGWKMYTVSKVSELIILEDSFKTRPDYTSDDKGLIEVYCEI